MQRGGQVGLEPQESEVGPVVISRCPVRHGNPVKSPCEFQEVPGPREHQGSPVELIHNMGRSQNEGFSAERKQDTAGNLLDEVWPVARRQENRKYGSRVVHDPSPPASEFTSRRRTGQGSSPSTSARHSSATAALARHPPDTGAVVSKGQAFQRWAMYICFSASLVTSRVP